MKKVETKEFNSESSDMRPIKCRKLLKKIKSEEEKEKGENFPKMEVCYLPQSPPKDEFYTTNINMVKEEVDDEDYNTSTSTPRDDDYIHFPFTNYKFVKEHFDGMYNLLRSIHLGSSAHVLLCFYRLQPCECILKVFHTTKMFSEKASKEINLLQMLAKHDHTGQHFVRMITWFKHSNHTCIVLDLLGLNLRKYLVEHTSRQKFSIDDIYQLGRQMLESVALMHDLHLIHTDLKPEHLLFASPEYIPSSEKDALGDYGLNYNKRFPKPFALKLIDFTSTIHHNDNEYHSDIVSTRQYRAPEVILGLGWSYPCDVWSVGCILAELYAEKIVFDQTNDDDLQHLAMMERVLGKFPSHMLEKTLHPVGKYFEDGKLNLPKSLTKEVMDLSPVQKLVRSHVSGNEADFINLLQGLLTCDPSERLTARDALRHPFFMEREIPDDPERVRAARHYANCYKGFKTFPRYH